MSISPVRSDLDMLAPLESDTVTVVTVAELEQEVLMHELVTAEAHGVHLHCARESTCVWESPRSDGMQPAAERADCRRIDSGRIFVELILVTSAQPWPQAPDTYS